MNKLDKLFDPHATPLYDQACSIDLPHLDYSVGWPMMLQEMERRTRIAEEKLRIAVKALTEMTLEFTGYAAKIEISKQTLKEIEKVGNI